MARLVLVASFMWLLPDAVHSAEFDAQKHQARLDRLFVELHQATSSDAAQRVEERIWEAWLQSGDEEIDGMMRHVLTAMRLQKFRVALDILDNVVAKAPNYAEGWNKRATILYLMDSYDKSLADIDKVLALEPRHFGAISGMALILTIKEDRIAAIAAVNRALKVHPYLKGARRIIERNGGTFREQRGI